MEIAKSKNERNRKQKVLYNNDMHHTTGSKQ
jgi:hypothetical protein